jgi:hypothetical protein
MDLVWKFFGCLVSLTGPVFQFWKSIKERFDWNRKAREAVGSLGASYGLIYGIPLAIITITYFGIVFLSLLGLAGGTIKVLSDPNVAKDLASSDAPRIQAMPSAQRGETALTPFGRASQCVFNHSLYLVLLFATLAALVHFDIVHRIAILLVRPLGYFFPGLTYRPGWINAHWHVAKGDDAVPVYPNGDACDGIADAILNVVEKLDSSVRIDYAKSPSGLSEEEKANVLLFGNVVESSIHDFVGSYPVGFSALYDAIVRVAQHEARPFGAKYLRQMGPKDLYTYLQDMTAKEAVSGSGQIFPVNVSIQARVAQVKDLLTKKYGGSAWRLAHGLFGRESGWLVLRRLRGFDGFNKPKQEAMRLQFLKLATSWEVWPAMKPGSFVYPFSTKVASLLLSTGCLRTRPDVDTIHHDTAFEKLCARTMSEVVCASERILNALNDQRRAAVVTGLLGPNGGSLTSWRLLREIDTLIWSQSRRDDRGYLKDLIIADWTRQDNYFRKSSG